MSNIGNNFAFSKFWLRSHQINILWPKFHWLIHTSISNPSCSRRNWKKSRANCYTRTDPFFPTDLLRCGWRTLALLLMASTLAMGGEFLVETMCSPNCCQYNRTQGTNHWHLVKVKLRFVSLKRKRVRWKKKILLSHAKDTRTKQFFLPMKLYVGISCITRQLSDNRLALHS